MNASLITLLLISGLAERPDLVGRIVTSGDRPLAGAHVLIDSAAVRQGTSPLCPSCYADCRKSAETDKEGHFRIASVDPELIFNVLVVADGFQPTIARKADTAKGPLKVVLSPLELDKLDPRRRVARCRARPGREAARRRQGLAADVPDRCLQRVFAGHLRPRWR